MHQWSVRASEATPNSVLYFRNAPIRWALLSVRPVGALFGSGEHIFFTSAVCQFSHQR